MKSERRFEALNKIHKGLEAMNEVDEYFDVL